MSPCFGGLGNSCGKPLFIPQGNRKVYVSRCYYRVYAFGKYAESVRNSESIIPQALSEGGIALNTARIRVIARKRREMACKGCFKNCA